VTARRLNLSLALVDTTADMDWLREQLHTELSALSQSLYERFAGALANDLDSFLVRHQVPATGAGEDGIRIEFRFGRAELLLAARRALEQVVEIAHGGPHAK
jgi:hypothetical protein